MKDPKINNYKKYIFNITDKIKIWLKDHLIATDVDPILTRIKHKRIGVLLVIGVIALAGLSIIVGNELDKKHETSASLSNKPKTTEKIEINKLASGVTNEQIWLETAQQELTTLKETQENSLADQDNLKKYVTGETVSKEELVEILKEFESDLEKKYSGRLEEEIKALSHVRNEQVHESPIEVRTSKPKAKIKQIGEYIPAGSYANASLISGVDAGVGITATEDPRQVLLRITGKAISAGYGSDYLTTNKLMGCLVQCTATGDLSSEKVYLKPVIMTCAKSVGTIIEIPIKGYITASGKNGIRGEVVSREGDLVAKSFLSGLVGGIGNGASSYYQPNVTLSGSGLPIKHSEQISNIVGTGFGSGLNQSANRLSDYLIKRAEQYQPVISINEGTQVTIVFQEGVFLNEGEPENVKH